MDSAQKLRMEPKLNLLCTLSQELGHSVLDHLPMQTQLATPSAADALAEIRLGRDKIRLSVRPM